MSESILEELLNLEKSFEGKKDEFLQAIEEIQKKGDLSIKDNLVCEGTKAKTYMTIGSFGDAIKITNNLYEEAKANNIPLSQIDALILRFYMKWMVGDFNYPQLWENIEESENLLKEASDESPEDIEFRRIA